MLKKHIIKTFHTLDVHMREVVLGASAAFLLKLVAALLTLIFNIVLARFLGSDGAGIFFLAYTILLVANVFSLMGLENALLRFVAVHSSSGDWGIVKSLYRKGMCFSITGAVVTSLVLFFTSPWISVTVFGKKELSEPLQYMAFVIVPYVVFWVHGELLKSLKRTSLALFVQSVSLPLFSLVGILLLQFVSVTEIIWVFLVSATITAFISHLSWKMTTPDLSRYFGDFPTQILLNSAIPLYLVAILNLLINWGATVILGIWADSSEVGIFSVAQRTAMLTSFILIAVNSIAAPKFATLYEQGDFEALGKTARNVAKLATLAAGPVLALFIFVPEWIMCFFGEQFTSGGTLLSILAIGQFVNVATGSVTYLLMMSGNGKLLLKNMLFSASVSILLCLVLIPLYGAIGAAIATAVITALMNIISAYFVWKRLHIWTIPIGLKSFGRSLV